VRMTFVANLAGANGSPPNNSQKSQQNVMVKFRCHLHPLVQSEAAAMSEHKDPHRTDDMKKTPLVAHRLRLLQEMFEGTGRGASLRMAERLEITSTCWSNVLTASPLSIRLAQRIVLTFPGVSLDWLYLGRPEGLSCQIAEKLGYATAHFQLGAVEQKTSQEQRRSPAIQTPQ
jgi:hypothetical protein